MRHRNTRRRPYRPFGYYFITTNVREGFDILDSKLFGHLLEYTLQVAAHINECRIIAYKINPDHSHLVVQIGASKTISQFVGSFKRNFTREANVILERCFPEKLNHQGWDLNPNLGLGISKFKWQSSYYSHLITTKCDFDNHIAYIKTQHIKHKLHENKFCYIDKSIEKE